LTWHLTRIQDDHAPGLHPDCRNLIGSVPYPVAGGSNGNPDRFTQPRDVQTCSACTASGRSPGNLLVGYHDAVYEQTTRYVAGLIDADLARIVDESWDPPVSLRVRLVSVIADDLQYAGRAVFVRGIVEH